MTFSEEYLLKLLNKGLPAFGTFYNGVWEGTHQTYIEAYRAYNGEPKEGDIKKISWEDVLDGKPEIGC